MQRDAVKKPTPPRLVAPLARMSAPTSVEILKLMRDQIDQTSRMAGKHPAWTPR